MTFLVFLLLSGVIAVATALTLPSPGGRGIMDFALDFALHVEH
jgi:uncharacterized membrane protein YbhN (UPF0104 family)